MNYKNFAYTTVATAPSPAISGTSLVVATGEGTKFPVTPFYASIWPAGKVPSTANAEIVQVTNIVGDTLTIVRTQEGTSARAITVGDQISQTVTAATFLGLTAVGNMVFVDAALGVDSTGTRGNAARPFLTVAAALAAASAGDCVMLRPGTYNLAAGITIPTGVALKGTDSLTTIVQMLAVAADTILVTMGVGSRVEDLTLNLTTTGNYALTGISWPSTTTAAGRCNRVLLNVTKTVDTGIKSVLGIYINSSGAPDASLSNIRASMINVNSTGTATNRALLMDTTVGTFNSRDCNYYCAGSGSAISAELNIAGSSISFNNESFFGTTADISQTVGTIYINACWLRNRNANGKGFTPSPAQIIGWGAEGTIGSGAGRYMTPGSGIDITNPRKIRSHGGVISHLGIQANTAPGGTDTVTCTLYVNGSATALTATITGAQIAADDVAHSVSVADGDTLSMGIVKSGGSAADIYANIVLI